MAIYDWMIGIGLTFGLALFLMFIVRTDVKGFFPLATFISVFMVYAGLYDSWVLVLLLIIDVVVIFIEIKGSLRGGGGI